MTRAFSWHIRKTRNWSTNYPYSILAYDESLPPDRAFYLLMYLLFVLLVLPWVRRSRSRNFGYLNYDRDIIDGIKS